MPDLDAQKWQAITGYLRDHHPSMCRQWFADLGPARLEGGLLEICCENVIQRNYLQNRCLEPFTEAAQQTFQQLIAVAFVDRPGEAGGTADAASEAAAQRTAEVAGFPAAQADGATGPAATADDAPSPAAAMGSTASSPEPRARPRPQTPPRRPVTSLEELTTPRSRGDHKDDLDPEFGSPLILSPDFAFEQFVEGPNNDMAFAAAQAVADLPAEAYNPLFIHGGVGLGKTHLLKAVCQRILSRQPDFQIVYVTCENFTNQFLEHVRGGDMKAFRGYYRDADMLVVDDIHFLSDKERSQEEFFHTFNELHQSKKQIVLSSDAPPAEIPGLTERLTSRFNWGVVCKVGPPSFETRVAILKAKAALRERKLPDEVSLYLARRIDTNIRELEGALNNTFHAADLRRVPVSMAIAREVQDDPDVAPPARVTLQRIIEVVTDFYGVKVSELQSRRRHQSIAEPRQVCMFLARKLTKLSLEEIGGHFGGRDHTTVMHSVQKIENLEAGGGEFETQLDLLRTRVQNAA